IIDDIVDDYGREGALINLRPNVEYQEFDGFGGAFTESASTTLDKLSKSNREKILKLYFDKDEGIGYTLGRVHINSCDFSLGNYTCVEEGDKSLETFNINRDKSSIIPMILEANNYAPIKILATPWSPPAYMKTNNQMNGGGKLKEEYFNLWAEYYVKFIKAYRECGVDICAITVQNEPKAAPRWDSCLYTAEEERDFVKNYLGKKMQEIGVKVFFWDHNKERVIDRASVMLSDETASSYVEGLAFHWYSGDYFEELEMFHKLYPNKKLIFTEGCYEYVRGKEDTVRTGERYAHDIIGNFNNYCNAFIDWNLILDEKGGPNHVENYCDAPIMVDTINDTFEIHASYYYIGHFSKYIKKGAKRIGNSKFTKGLESLAFKNLDGSIILVVLNTNDYEEDFFIRIYDKLIKCKAESHSISTYIITDL
ncbi:MAG: glucosylceramidase, partial [Clostridia bacterium]|nr:glucosylceramidase [Clostridia bacterium]